MIISSLTGLDQLTSTISKLKAQFDGGPANKVILNGARVIAAEVKKNLHRGPTGNLLRSVQCVSAKKASKQGAAAIVRENAYSAPHAILIEEGTSDYTGLQRIPLSKLAFAGSSKTRAKLRGGKNASLAGAFGYLFTQKRKGVTAQHPFQRAVESKLSAAQDVIEQGLRKLAEDATK